MHATLVVEDESGFSLVSPLKRTWAPRGQTPCVRTSLDHHERLNLLGAILVTPKGRQLKLMIRSHCRTLRGEEVIAFLQQILDRVSGPIVMVWDRHPIHKRKMVQEFLAKHKRLHMFYNPVFQNAHNYGDILFTLGKALITEVRSVGGGEALCRRIQFATEVNPVARIAYGLYRGGFLNAVSVGFIPLRWEDGGNGSASVQGAPAPRRRFLEQELLEVSAVAIPANPDALAMGLKSGAIEKCDLEAALDLFRTLLGAGTEATPPHVGAYQNEWIDLAREVRRVMRKA